MIAWVQENLDFLFALAGMIYYAAAYLRATGREDRLFLEVVKLHEQKTELQRELHRLRSQEKQ